MFAIFPLEHKKAELGNELSNKFHVFKSTSTTKMNSALARMSVQLENSAFFVVEGKGGDEAVCVEETLC